MSSLLVSDAVFGSKSGEQGSRNRTNTLGSSLRWLPGISAPFLLPSRKHAVSCGNGIIAICAPLLPTFQTETRLREPKSLLEGQSTYDE